MSAGEITVELLAKHSSGKDHLAMTGGTLNADDLVFVATASSASWSPIPLALRVRSAQLSGLNLLKLST